MKLEQVTQSIPQSIQTATNWSAVGAAMASFFGAIQGPLAAIASLLSICWLSLQIYSWWRKRK